MFKFFQDKNRNSKLIKRGLIFGFVFLLVFTTVFGGLPTKIFHAGIGATLESIFLFIPNLFLTLVASVMLTIASLFLWISSGILDLILNISIIDTGMFFDNEGIKTAWKVFRDIANMSFIFILLYIAIGI